MKKVFKKNQIIISALAIMIAVAGYLNFTKEKTEDPLGDLNTQMEASLENEDLLNASEQGNEETALTADLSNEDEFADISDEDLIANDPLAVNDAGELVKQENDVASGSADTDTPGEAVLASTTLGNAFFANAKLAREQTRSKNKQALMDVIADTAVSEEQKQAAIDCIISMTATAEMENAAELLLEAKGFEGVVVNILEGNVDVVVNASAITDAQVAQIEDIVMRKTNITADHIVITSVVVEE